MDRASQVFLYSPPLPTGDPTVTTTATTTVATQPHPHSLKRSYSRSNTSAPDICDLFGDQNAFGDITNTLFEMDIPIPQPATPSGTARKRAPPLGSIPRAPSTGSWFSTSAVKLNTSSLSLVADPPFFDVSVPFKLEASVFAQQEVTLAMADVLPPRLGVVPTRLDVVPARLDDAGSAATLHEDDGCDAVTGDAAAHVTKKAKTAVDGTAIERRSSSAITMQSDADVAASVKYTPALSADDTTKKGTKKEKPANAIPRPPNSFILYRRERHAAITADYKSAAGKVLNNNVISKIVASMWQNESPEVKALYTAKAEAAKKMHREKYPNYKYQPRKVARGPPKTAASDDKARHVAGVPAHAPIVPHTWLAPPTGPAMPFGAANGILAFHAPAASPAVAYDPAAYDQAMSVQALEDLLQHYVPNMMLLSSLGLDLSTM
ncbi:hypothetical protein SeMB42_g00168 [Synchytrium endobioticum]|uniref:HMG box domain-containing protein n=1 Tax=Synchytrium endobioticum TaxID=286115 RepID=A0A507DT66_9FUNG|nr:hypothetical protein SeMB42_g00168 [Synchytrium endobioticum]